MTEGKEEKLEIVVVTYNTPTELNMCLSSVFLFTKNSRVIIVDNGDDKLPLMMMQQEEIIKAVIQRGNLGFCKGVNMGVEEVETERFAILPADCMLTDGWENRMLYQIPTLKNPGIVAPMCTQTSGSQGIERQGLLGITQMVKRVILNGAVMRKEDFLKVGGMDEGFPNKGGNFSDDDLSRRFYNEKYNNYILDHVIYHNQGRSYGGRKEMFVNDMREGEAYYRRKWKDVINY